MRANNQGGYGIRKRKIAMICDRTSLLVFRVGNLFLEGFLWSGQIRGEVLLFLLEHPLKRAISPSVAISQKHLGGIFRGIWDFAFLNDHCHLRNQLGVGRVVLNILGERAAKNKREELFFLRHITSTLSIFIV
jgi:hypothetical protein